MALGSGVTATDTLLFPCSRVSVGVSGFSPGRRVKTRSMPPMEFSALHWNSPKAEALATSTWGGIRDTRRVSQGGQEGSVDEVPLFLSLCWSPPDLQEWKLFPRLGTRRSWPVVLR